MEQILDGVYFSCTEIKSELLKEVGVTPETLTRFIVSAMPFDYEDFEDCNYNSLKGWEDADGISNCMEDILPLMNYNKWSEEEQESEKYYGVMDELQNEVARCIKCDDNKDVKISYLNDGSQGDQFFILTKNCLDTNNSDVVSPLFCSISLNGENWSKIRVRAIR